jgi:hypothetical protein
LIGREAEEEGAFADSDEEGLDVDERCDGAFLYWSHCSTIQIFLVGVGWWMEWT